MDNMKLYATTTSERASKGQGGNSFIDIAIFDSDKQPLMTIKVTPTGDGYEYEQLFYSTRIQIKGEKQKTL